MSNKRNKNRRAWQNQRATSKCERRNAAKREEKRMREQRQREYIEEQMELARKRADVKKAAAETKVSADATGAIFAEKGHDKGGIPNAPATSAPDETTASDIDLSLRWHVVDKTTGDVLTTATSRAKAQEASKAIESDTKVVDSTK
jgi:hypothetical protein